jgi:hypothetical protein
MNINSLTTSLFNIFTAANTTTADNDLSDGLNSRIKKIYKGVEGMHEDLPVTADLYPVLFLEAATSEREIEELGKTSRRQIKVNYTAVGITHYGMSSGDQGEGRQNSDMEALQLASNIEAFVDNNIRPTSTLLWLLVTDSDYSTKIADKTYNSISKVSLQIELRR